MNVKDLIIKHEAIVLHPYIDSVGKETIGVGHNLTDNGISHSTAMFILDEDIAIAKNELYDIFEDFDELPEDVQAVMIDMMFNLGYSRFSKFKRMIAAIKIRDFKTAAKEARDSKWCKQVGSRCDENCSILLQASQ